MQKDLHPVVHAVEVKCNSCGATFATETTNANLKSVEVCSNCHPFYAGTQKQSAKGGRIDKFNAKYEEGKIAKKMPKKEKVAKEEPKEDKE